VTPWLAGPDRPKAAPVRTRAPTSGPDHTGTHEHWTTRTVMDETEMTRRALQESMDLRDQGHCDD
jgi:hypothetical protein